jgi:predicted Zn-ribbon and HTH transcriptional regulator
MTTLEKAILDVLEQKQPGTVRELVHLVQEQVDATLEDIEKEVKKLHKEGQVLIEEPKQKESFISFLSSRKSRWFWILIVLLIISFCSSSFSTWLLPDRNVVSK